MTIAIPRLDRSTAAERGLTLADFLVPVRVAERLPTRLRHALLISAGTLIVILCTQIVIPTLPVPFTGQTFGVLVVGGALGFRRGAAALLLYLAIGVLGIGGLRGPLVGRGEARRARRAGTSSRSSSRPPSSAGWPSSAGTAGWAGRW